MEDIGLEPVAAAIGAAWVRELIHTLHTEDREVIGAWPGTMSEARMRIRTTLRIRLDADALDQLARIANLAARRGWRELANADPER